MTVNFGVYAKKRPEFKGFLQEDLGIQPHSENRLGKTWRWRPRESEYTVYIEEGPEPNTYGVHGLFDHPEAQNELNKKGPLPFVHYVNRKNGLVDADQELYGISQKHPQLRDLYPEAEPVWGILEFTHGKPTYNIEMWAQIGASQKALGAMLQLAQFLASRYNGIVWNEQTESFETS